MRNFLTTFPLQIPLLQPTADTVAIAGATKDSSKLFGKGFHEIINISSDAPKFWLLEDLWQWFRDIGIGTVWANILAFIVAAVAVGILIWLLDALLQNIMMKVVRKQVGRSENKFDDFLLARHFFQRVFDLIPLLVLIMTVDTVFDGFNNTLVWIANLITRVLIVFAVMRIANALLNAFNDQYESRIETHKRSIKGYIQVAKIVIGIIIGLVIIAIVTESNPTKVIAGLGAAAALISLVFKDTIMGFVASVQLSAQDMLRPGDWIEMPSQNADGRVLDINISSVKVRNWDNTITMIPVLSMVNQSFINWRGIQKSNGRRFVRSINIDIKSVAVADDKLMDYLKSDPLVSATFYDMVALAQKSSPHALTNLALYRAFLEIYLRTDPMINSDEGLYVRYKSDSTSEGLLMEVYAFSKDKTAEVFDLVHRSTMEYIIVTAPLFGISIFQRPTGSFQKNSELNASFRNPYEI